MWKHTRCDGHAPDFSPILPEDDYLHPVIQGAHFTSIETYLLGFNIPSEDIHCNIYLLWHPVLRTVSAHIFVYKGARILPHQLAADYIVDHQFLPAATGQADIRLQLGSCAIRLQIIKSLEEIKIDVDDPMRLFALNLRYVAAMAPVSRPGGKHFTQLMKTEGSLTLDGRPYVIDGFYMRDRSWGYERPEQPEKTPPYRWITGWFDAQNAFVLAWLDTSLLNDEAFGPDWHRHTGGAEGQGHNKWESGGPTPSLNLRSGWISVGGVARQVVGLDIRTLVSIEPGHSKLQVQRIEIRIEDATGQVHEVHGETRSMIPKMYWQSMLTYMHAMQLSCNGQTGHGDLMDTYSGHHIRRFGL